MVTIGKLQLGEFPLLLAPMEDVSDPPFRALCKEYGADVMYTEFISSEGLIRDAAKSVQKLDIFEYERPIGIQLFGGDTDSMVESVRIAEQAQPDIIDINFGCPVKKVVCKGGGAGILKDIDKMERMTRELVKATHLPVTVKTRLGWDQDSIRIVEVALRLQDAGIKALTVHARTRAQMYKGEADWTYLQAIKDHPDFEIPLFGNGDVDGPEKAAAMRAQFDVDGIMIGRGAIGNPWVFNQIKHYLATGELLLEPSLAERVEACRRHLEMSLDWKGKRQGVHEMRRHYANYFKGLPNFKPIRQALVQEDEPNRLLEILASIPEHEALLAVA